MCSNVGTIYLLHFAEPFGHARHYLGWSADLDARLAHHANGSGANLLRHVRAAGIDWTLARTWTGDRHRERALKNMGGHSRKCPICRAQAACPHPNGRQSGELRLSDGELLAFYVCDDCGATVEPFPGYRKAYAPAAIAA